MVGEILSDATRLAFWFDSWAVPSVAGVIPGVLEAAQMLGCIFTPSYWGVTGLGSDSCCQATGRLHVLPSFHPSVPQEGQEMAETPWRSLKGHLQENRKHWTAVCWLPSDLHVAVVSKLSYKLVQFTYNGICSKILLFSQVLIFVFSYFTSRTHCSQLKFPVPGAWREEAVGKNATTPQMVFRGHPALPDNFGADRLQRR